MSFVNSKSDVLNNCAQMNKFIEAEVCAAIKKFTTMTKFITEEAFSDKMLGFCLDTAGLSVKKLQLKSIEKKWTPEQHSLELACLIQKRVELAPAVYRLMVIALSDSRSHLVKCVRSEVEGVHRQRGRSCCCCSVDF